MVINEKPIVCAATEELNSMLAFELKVLVPLVRIEPVVGEANAPLIPAALAVFNQPLVASVKLPEPVSTLLVLSLPNTNTPLPLTVKVLEGSTVMLFNKVRVLPFVTK